MARSTHPAIAALSKAELWSERGCTVEVAMVETGLPQCELYRLMREGVLPWMRPGRWRIIPRRALTVYLEALYEADPEPESVNAPPIQQPA